MGYQNIRYRNWLITLKLIEGKLWFQWQHPEENFFHYGVQVVNNHLADTFDYVKFLIDLAINLEEEAAGNKATQYENNLKKSIISASILEQSEYCSHNASNDALKVLSSKIISLAKVAFNHRWLRLKGKLEREFQ